MISLRLNLVTRLLTILEAPILTAWETGIPVQLTTTDADDVPTRLAVGAYIKFGCKRNADFTGPLLASVETWTRGDTDADPYTGTLDLNGADLIELLANTSPLICHTGVLWQVPAGENEKQSLPATPLRIRNALHQPDDTTPNPSPIFGARMFSFFDLDASNVTFELNATTGKITVTASGGGGGSLGPDLTAIEALSGTGILTRTAPNTWALVSTFTALTISDFATAADARITAAIGASVQAYNAALTTFATNGSAYYLSRANHSGSQTAATISDFSDASDARITAQKAQANGLATLGSDSKIPTAQLPALAITETSVVASQVAMLALTAQIGDVAVRSDLNKSFILAGSDPTVLGNWQELLTPTDTVLSVNGQTGAITLTTTHIAEGTNQYFTNTRADARITAAIGSTVQAYNAALTTFATNGSAHYLSRANHTGTQAASTVTGLPEGPIILLSGPTAISDATTGQKASWEVPEAFSLLAADVRLRAGTAPSGSTFIADIEKNGASIYSTRPSIASGENSSSSGGGTVGTLSTSPTTFAIGDVLGVFVDQIGAVTAGADASLSFVIRK